MIQTRFKTVFDALHLSPNAFALSHGINAPIIYSFVNGTRSPSFETLANICAAEPRISAEYLLRGEGEPLRDVQRSVALSTVEQLKEFRSEVLQSLDKRIQELGG